MSIDKGLWRRSHWPAAVAPVWCPPRAGAPAVGERRARGARLTSKGSAFRAGISWAAALLLGATAAGSACAEDIAVRTRAILDAHCARCHQAGRLENPPAKGHLGNILDLERLVERDDLIVASDPDASRLYQILLARHRPLTAFFGPIPGPTTAEIDAVRAWIAGLQPGGMPCRDKPPVTQADLRRDIAAWRAAFEPDASKPLRFVSLANLHNLCRSDATIAAYRDAVAALLSRLTLKANVTLDTVGEASVLLAFRPSDFGLTADAWDLRAGGGHEIAGVVDADALAARAIAATSSFAVADGGGAIGQAVAAPAPVTAVPGLIDGIDAVEALALEYTRPVAMHRAALELALDEAALRVRLAAVTGSQRELALQLAAHDLTRAEWEQLRAVLEGRAVDKDATAIPAGADRLRIALWTDAPAYRTGDLLTVRARPNGDCNLTLIAVESDGLATVLYPNDTSVDNRVGKGSTVLLPPPSAPFQIRLDKPGRQSVIAICNATAKRPEGIGHDFERQRFTVLGDWRTFLAETAVREAAYQKTQDDLRKFRTGAGNAETLDDQLPIGSEEEARAAVSFSVEP